jgi:putative glutamine amidotransferase
MTFIKQRLNIGILFADFNSNKTGINTAYVNFAQRLNKGNVNVKFISSLDRDVDKSLDGLILPGGRDVDPLLYNTVSPPSVYQGAPNPHATWWYSNMLKKYISEGIPLMGICMGFQQVGAIFGCNLRQHLYLNVSDPRQECIESMVYPDGHKQAGELLAEINSIHHQGFFPKDINQDEFTVIGVSDEYGTVEAMSADNFHFIGFQYHPEEILCNYAEQQFLSLISKAKKLDAAKLIF